MKDFYKTLFNNCKLNCNEYVIETKNDPEYDLMEKRAIKYMINIIRNMFQVVKEEKV